MELDTYVAYVIASLIVMVAPGPTVMLVAAHATAWGGRRSLYTILGVALSCSLLFVVFALGAAALMGALADFFAWVKLAGAAYLVWLGLQQWRADPHQVLGRGTNGPRRTQSLALQGFFVNITNPKSLIFFAAFLPPFLDPAVPAAPQLVIMGATFIGILVGVCCSYAFIAARARRFLNDRRRVRIANRATGTLLVGTGLALVASRRS
jgi:threonine/homoserine/homoserine lactone efflux protein